MNVTRRQDPVQCRICGFEGPSCTAATCPRCRTSYQDGAKLFSRYAPAAEVVAVTSEVLGTHADDFEVAVVREIPELPGVFHVGALVRANMADTLVSREQPMARPGDVVFISPKGNRVLRWGDPTVLRELMSI